MSKNSSVIEINGKRYDAVTGKVIGAVKKIAQPAASGSIDGFTRAKSRLGNSVKQPASLVHKRTQKAKTLMRSNVKRPAPLKNLHRIITAKKISSVSASRLSRATSIHRSDHVSRFSVGIPKTAALASRRRSTAKIIVPTPVADSQSGLALAKPLPSLVTSVSHQRLERLLDEALAKADAHKQMIKQLRKRSWWHKLNFLPKWLSVVIITVGLLAAGAVFAWQKVPVVSLKLAANKANISASLPAYKPEGFSVAGPVQYHGGSVVMSYRAGGNQSYSLSQKASDWDSVSLAANSIPSNTPVQTSQVKGTTVYIYGEDNDATWVDNGIRYTLKDKAELSSDQIIKIAKSM